MVPPLVLALAIALAVVASISPLSSWIDAEREAALYPLVDRFLGNVFSRTMFAVFLASGLYGLLQLLGIRVDRRRIRSLEAAGASNRSWVACLAGRPLRQGTVHVLQGQEFGSVPSDLADRYSLQRHRYAELGMLPLRYTVWVLPLLGFIGTVVGIARSITGLEAVIAPGAGGQATEGLLVVLGGLRFAFDTTLLGLVTVIPVMLLQMVLGGRESQVNDEAHHRVLSLLTAQADSGSSEPQPHPASISTPPPSGHSQG
ncbi:MAG: MotA/TolQ/ExbB proton channel family protein [Candidatus Tectomicrobia bacterium]|nr:MotA/TolQ/ExbB proton channel family protein [Candidatus Tectomicrobia bacterium]